MKLLSIFASTTLIGSLAFLSPAHAAESPTVDSVLTKYVTALGGKGAMEKVKSRVVKIKIESETIGAGEGEISAKAPNKATSHIELPGIGAMIEGFDGSTGWAKSPWEGLRVKAGDELAKTKREAVFHRELNLKATYPDLALKGMETVGGEDVWVLESKPTATSKERLSISSKTGLLVRQESDFEGPQGTVNAVILVQDYKTVDGLKFPSQMKMKYSAGGQTFEFTMKVLEVKYNIAIEDGKFAKPSA